MYVLSSAAFLRPYELNCMNKYFENRACGYHVKITFDHKRKHLIITFKMRCVHERARMLTQYKTGAKTTHRETWACEKRSTKTTTNNHPHSIGGLHTHKLHTQKRSLRLRHTHTDTHTNTGKMQTRAQRTHKTNILLCLCRSHACACLCYAMLCTRAQRKCFASLFSDCICPQLDAS